jgi:hypothetical protein
MIYNNLPNLIVDLIYYKLHQNYQRSLHDELFALPKCSRCNKIIIRKKIGCICAYGTIAIGSNAHAFIPYGNIAIGSNAHAFIPYGNIAIGSNAHAFTSFGNIATAPDPNTITRYIGSITTSWRIFG